MTETISLWQLLFFHSYWEETYPYDAVNISHKRIISVWVPLVIHTSISDTPATGFVATSSTLLDVYGETQRFWGILPGQHGHITLSSAQYVHIKISLSSTFETSQYFRYIFVEEWIWIAWPVIKSWWFNCIWFDLSISIS